MQAKPLRTLPAESVSIKRVDEVFDWVPFQDLKSNPVQLIQILAGIVLRIIRFSAIIQAEHWLTQAGVAPVWRRV